jgi:hypothetical protein
VQWIPQQEVSTPKLCSSNAECPPYYACEFGTCVPKNVPTWGQGE